MNISHSRCVAIEGGQGPLVIVVPQGLGLQEQP